MVAEEIRRRRYRLFDPLKDTAQKTVVNKNRRGDANTVSLYFVTATQEHFDRGAKLYEERSDKKWSLVDCISFITMAEQGLTDPPTTDHHFTQADFNALITDPGG